MLQLEKNKIRSCEHVALILLHVLSFLLYTYLHISGSSSKLLRQNTQRIDHPNGHRRRLSNLLERLLNPNAVESPNIMPRPNPPIQNPKYLLRHVFEKRRILHPLSGYPVAPARPQRNRRQVPRPNQGAIALQLNELPRTNHDRPEFQHHELLSGSVGYGCFQVEEYDFGRRGLIGWGVWKCHFWLRLEGFDVLVV